MKEVREFKDKEGLGGKVIIAVPFYYLRLTVMEMLSKANRKFEHVDGFTVLCQKAREQKDQILIIDILAFPKNQRNVLTLLIRKNPRLSVIYLFYGEEMAHISHLRHNKSCFFVEKETMDTELLAALTRALQERELRQRQLSSMSDREENAVEKGNDNIFGQKFGRRSFLKGTVAAAALTGVAMSGPGNTVIRALAEGEDTQTAAAGDQVFLSCCGTACLQSCPLHVIVRDGKIVRTKAADLKGGTDNSRICARGSSWQHRVYSDQRIKHPYKRIGERGSGQWEQITWDEAFKTVTDKLSEIKAQYGGGAIAVDYEGGTMASDNSFVRWANVVGVSKIGCNDDQMSIQLIPNTVGALVDNAHAKNIIIIGAGMTQTKLQDYRYIADAVNDNGARLIVIDPIFTPQASKADIFAPIRPGTDAALLMAIVNYIEQNKLAADESMKKVTELPFLVKEADGLFLRKSDLNGGEGAGTPEDDVAVWDADANKYGYAKEVVNPELRGSYEINGIKVNTAYNLLLKRVAPFTVEKTSRICDLPVSMIEEIAKACADNSAITLGMGIDHWKGGLGSIMAVSALQMVTGGLKFVPTASAPSIYWPQTGFALNEVNHPSIAPVELSPWMLIPLVEKGKCEVEGGATIEQPIKAIVHLSGGRGNGSPDHNRTIAMWKKLDFFVVSDILWNDNIEYADVILPAATQMEFEWLMNSTIYLIACEKTIDPLYESKSPVEISKPLAEGMGEGKWFEGISTEADVSNILMGGNSTYASMGMTVDKVKQAGGYITFNQPSTSNAFYTASGRAVLYLEKPVPMKNYGQKFDVEKVRLPYFDPPIEAWTQTIDEYPKNPLADKYPLNYITGPNRYRVHGGFSHDAILRELDDEPSVQVNPNDAETRGIKDGDHVKLYNDRGYVVARCIFNPGVRPGVVCMDRGWQHSQYVDKKGHFNSLTHYKMDPACYNHMLYDVLCEMEKA